MPCVKNKFSVKCCDKPDFFKAAPDGDDISEDGSEDQYICENCGTIVQHVFLYEPDPTQPQLGTDFWAYLSKEEKEERKAQRKDVI